MSFKVMMVGIAFIVISIAAGIILSTSLSADNATLYIYFNMIVGTIMGIFVAVIAFTTNGCLGPLMSAKTSGESIINVATASDKWRWRTGKEQNGLVPTKDGEFLITPGSMLSLPNGVKFANAYYKEGVTIPPKYAVACAKMKKAGINDINQAEEVARRNGGDFEINLS